MRTLMPPLLALAALVGIAVLRFALPGASGLMLFELVPIALLGMMFGVRAGLLAALFASTAYLVWAATKGHPNTLEWINDPLTFFVLGGITGYFARGALGRLRLEAGRNLQRAPACTDATGGRHALSADRPVRRRPARR